MMIDRQFVRGQEANRLEISLSWGVCESNLSLHLSWLAMLGTATRRMVLYVFLSYTHSHVFSGEDIICIVKPALCNVVSNMIDYVRCVTSQCITKTQV